MLALKTVKLARGWIKSSYNEAPRDLYTTLHIIDVIRNTYSQKTQRKYHFNGEGIYGRIALKQNACEGADYSTGIILALVTMVMKIRF